MIGPSLVQIVATLVVGALLYGAVELLPIETAKLKRYIGSAILLVAAVWLSWRFLLPGLPQ